MPADHRIVLRGLEEGAVSLELADVEVVAPEIDHHLLELPAAVDGANDRCLLQLGLHLLLRKLEPEVGIHLQSIQGPQAPGDGRTLLQPLGMKLLLQVRVDAHLADTLQLSRPRAKRSSVHDAPQHRLGRRILSEISCVACPPLAGLRL